ncbi:MAG: hypothetical protein KAS99_04730 [Candidatus Omnitrophica bacterium]|nr:hypothetical protein [Candidatus Omnitrophota bacterium]
MEKKEFFHKIVSFVSREELDFLDKITKDIYFSTGKKIPRSQIIREIIRASKNLNIVGNDLVEKLMDKNNQKNFIKREDG